MLTISLRHRYEFTKGFQEGDAGAQPKRCSTLPRPPPRHLSGRAMQRARRRAALLRAASAHPASGKTSR